MVNVISYSLWGDNPLYNVGIIKNCELKNKFFNDWEMWVYHDDTVPLQTLEILKNNNVKLIPKKSDGFIKATWRFLPFSDKNVNFFISRDSDSRLSLRDKCAVDEWIESGKNFHVVRDHPVGHNWIMNAGMWGGKCGVIKDIENLIFDFSKYSNIHDKFFDQYFLSHKIYPLINNSLFSHDEYFNYENDSTFIKRDRKEDDFAFIGECIDIDETSKYTSNPGDQRDSIIKNYIKRI